jgi:hypothetical protein
MTAGEIKTVEKGGFEPRIVAFICNWCTSVFFFAAPSLRASPRKEKNWANKKLGLALHAGRSLATLGMRGE